VIFAHARAQTPDLSKLGVYGKTSTYCGTKEIARNPQAIPDVGCFYLSSGRHAIGTLASHHIDVSVDNAGVEVFMVDGDLVVDTRDTASGTNIAYVGASGTTGYRFCEGATDRNTGCPISLIAFSRNADKSIFFMVSECVPPNYRLCVTTQENWDYEKSRQH
jgi:hypothetical protein